MIDVQVTRVVETTSCSPQAWAVVRFHERDGREIGPRYDWGKGVERAPRLGDRHGRDQARRHTSRGHRARPWQCSHIDDYRVQKRGGKG